MATLTAVSAAANQPRVSTDGTLITRMQSYVSTATLTAATTITMKNLKIPHGATYRSISIKGSAPDGGAVFKVGTTGTANLFGSISLSAGVLATTTFDPAVGRKVSVSDDASTRYETIMLTVDANTSPTASVSVIVIVDYTMDI